MNKAIMIGASGLTGTELLKQLLNDDFFNEIVIFLRTKIEVTHPKLTQYQIDFDNIKHYEELINGDFIFCCLGTTIKKAGSKDEFLKVDFTYAVEFAKIARKYDVKSFLLQSSNGADSFSNIFYLKTKGETEELIKKLNFNLFVSFRPSMLLGKRKEFRLSENILKKLMTILSFLFIGGLKRYKAIHVSKVASAMIREAKGKKTGNFIVENEEMI